MREKGRDLTQSYDKSPYPHGKNPKASCQHKKATKNFDYTTIATDLGRSARVTAVNHTGVVTPVYERSTFPLTAKIV